METLHPARWTISLVNNSKNFKLKLNAEFFSVRNPQWGFLTHAWSLQMIQQNPVDCSRFDACLSPLLSWSVQESRVLNPNFSGHSGECSNQKLWWVDLERSLDIPTYSTKSQTCEIVCRWSTAVGKNLPKIWGMGASVWGAGQYDDWGLNLHSSA